MVTFRLLVVVEAAGGARAYTTSGGRGSLGASPADPETNG